MKRPTHDQFKRKSMPVVLKGLTGFCFASILFPIIALLPGHFTISGQEVSHAEFWRLGGGPTFVLIGILFPVCGYGFVSRKFWAPRLFMGILIAGILSQAIAGRFLPIYSMQAVDALQYCIFIPLLLWYLMFKKNVREYFAEAGEN
jgi:hypothetical protein